MGKAQQSKTQADTPARAGGLCGAVPRAGLQAQRSTHLARHTLQASLQPRMECLTDGPRDVFRLYAYFAGKEQDTKVK